MIGINFKFLQFSSIFKSNIKYIMKKYFITFGAGAQNFYDAASRLVKQVENLNLFDNINFFTDKDLQKDNYFWKKHSSFIINNKRGYGYWLWKPYLIKKTIEKMTDGDVLLYLDCGCEIDIKNKDKFISKFEIVKKDHIIGTNTNNPEKNWNKMDLICKLNMLDDKYLNTLQRQAGVVLYFISNETRKLINEWYNLASDYHYLDDTPSIKPNPNYFIEHRHDQAIFSLLTKKYNLYSNDNLNDCIKISRNKSGISKIYNNVTKSQLIFEQPKKIPTIVKPTQKIVPTLIKIQKLKILPKPKIIFNKTKPKSKIIFNKTRPKSKIIAIKPKRQLLSIKTFCLLNRQKK
jgi:hypothetical protein